MFFSQMKPGRRIAGAIIKYNSPPKSKTPHARTPDGKRTSAYSFLPAGFTVEASILLPMFLLTMYLFWSLFFALIFQVRLQYAMDEVTAELSQRAYLLEALQGESGGDVSDGGLSFGGAVSKAAWKAWAKSRLTNCIGKEAIEAAPVSGGLSLANSKWDLTGDIRLAARYQLRFPGVLGLVAKLPMEQVSTRKCWTGKQADGGGGGSDEDTLVYVTEYGRVYHEDINCYHLKITIHAVDASGVGGARNADGGRYRPCEHCAVAAQTSGTLYLTPEGDRYHVTKDCSGLKRMIKTVRRGSCGLPPCTNCGK